MVEGDIAFVKKCIRDGLVQSPCLELGVGYDGENCKGLVEAAGLVYVGTDREPGKDVDVQVDFEDSTESVNRVFGGTGPFGSVLVLNVLEHTFDPIRVLDNLFTLIASSGTAVIITPTVWPLHDYPFDCWRINPNFYEQYCLRRSLELLPEYFEFIGAHRVRERLDGGTYVLPRPSRSRNKELRSRVIHKIFHTSGRGMFFPSHVATAAVIRKRAPQEAPSASS